MTRFRNPSAEPANARGTGTEVTAVFLVATAAALLFCFTVYPRLAGPQHAVLDPDGYGQLGLNLWRGEGLTFDPAQGPTVWRGPLYPAFIGLALALGGGRYPESVWVAQALLHGVTCVFVYLFGARCWNRRVGLLASLGCAGYPV